MFRGDWSKRFTPKLLTGALIWSLVAMIGFGAITRGILEQVEYEGRSNERRAEYSADAYSPAYDACVRLAIGLQADCIAKANEEWRENERKEQDLIAQQTSAIWTFLMGCAAIIGMALSALGVWLVYTTFDETRKANRIAMRANVRATRQAVSGALETAKALDIARRNAEATIKLVETTQDSARREQRAYVTIAAITLNNISLGSKPKAFISIVNAGKTPAYEFSPIFYFGWRGSDFDEESLIIPESQPPESVSCLGPGQTANSFPILPIEWNDECAKRFDEGEMVLYFFGRITYRDAFGDHRETTFRSFHDRNCDTGHFMHCKTGNNET